MDSEAIVDQIVRSLSFEVVAVPQNVVHVDSPSKSTSLNVKIRVRKKHGSELRHGILSMPKVDTKSDSRKNEMLEQIRFVSSDQTIMNFNVLMGADFDKRHHKQNLNTISPDLDVHSVENSNLSKNASAIQTAPILFKRNKDIFGKCKPGGCLDPPFSEDKYSYQPAHQNIPLPVKDDPAKLRSSSIFKSNIFKRKKKCSQANDELNQSDTNNKQEVNSIANINDKGSLETTSPYINSIITYPHQSDSSEFHKQDNKKVSREEEQTYRKRFPSGERSKDSSIDDGSFFIIPKKTKNLSNQSYSNKMTKGYTKIGENHFDIIKPRDETNVENKYVSRTTTKTVRDKEIDEFILTSQARTLIPIPLVVPINSMVDPKLIKDNITEINANIVNNIQPTENKSQDKIKANISTDIMATYNNDNSAIDKNSETFLVLKKNSNSGPIISTGIEISSTTKGNHTQILRSIDPQDSSVNICIEDRKSFNNRAHSEKHEIIVELSNIQESANVELGISHNITSELKENINKPIIVDVNDNKHIINNQTDVKSHLLFADAREKSLIDVTAGLTDTVEAHSTPTENYICMLSKNEENNRNVPFNSQDLNQIWENDTEDLNSMADVITTKTMLPTKDNNEMNYGQNEMQHLPLFTFLDNVTINDEHSNIKKISEMSAGPYYNQLNDRKKQQKDLFLHDTISEIDFQAGLVTPSSIHSSKDDMTKKGLFDSSEKSLIMNANDSYVKNPDAFDKILQGSFLENKDSIQNYDLKNHTNETEAFNTILKENILENNDDMQNNVSELYTNENKIDNVDKTQKEVFKNLKISISVENIGNLNSDNILHIVERNKNENDTISSIKLDDPKNATNDIDKYDELSHIIDSLNSQSDKIRKQNNSLEHSDDVHVGKVGENTKIALKKTYFTSFSNDDNITIKGQFPYKSRRSVSDQSIVGSRSLTYIAANTSGKQDDKYLKISLSSDIDKRIILQNRGEDILNDMALEPEPHLFSEKENLELKTHPTNENDTGELNFELDQVPFNNLTDIFYKVSNASQPTLILRTGVVPWKIDIALQSYVDENNERIIKSFDSKDVPERRLNDAFFVARCYLGDELNEIKVPIDQNNDLSVKIVNSKPQHHTLVEFRSNSNSTEELFRKNKIEMNVSDRSQHHQHQSQADVNDSTNVTDKLCEKKRIKIDVPDSDIAEKTDYEESNKHNKAIMSGDIRNALNSIYEEELVPLQGIIKGLREEIDALVAYQMKLNIQNVTPKRSKPFRLVYSHRKCSCFRRL